jgi:integrase
MSGNEPRPPADAPVQPLNEGERLDREQEGVAPGAPTPLAMPRRKPGRPKKADTELLSSGHHRTRPTNPLTGKRESFTAGTKSQALAIKADYRDLRHRIENGRMSPTEAISQLGRMKGGIPRVRDLWDAYVATLETRTRKKCDSVWRHQLEPSFGKAHAFELTTSAMLAWEQRMRAQAPTPDSAQRHTHNAFVLLAAAMRRAVGDHKIPMLPWGSYKCSKGPKKEREALVSVEELERCILAASEIDREKQQYSHFSDRAPRFTVMALMALRQGEASGLGWDMVRIDEPPFTMKVHYQARRGWRKEHPDWTRPLDPPKRSRFKEDSRRAPIMHPAVVATLRHQRDRLIAKGWYRPNGPVFPNKTGGWREDSDCLYPRDVREICERAGIPNAQRWVTHGLRHSGITLEVLASRGDFKAVGARTGNKDLKVLREIYTHAGGRGPMPSFVGEVRGVGAAPPALPAHTPVADAAKGVDEAMVSLVNATVAEGARYEQEKQARRLEKKRAPRTNVAVAPAALGAAAKEWVAAGARGPLPKGVAARADANYVSAYGKVKARGGTLDEARDAGTKARRATMLNWKNAVKKALAATTKGTPE